MSARSIFTRPARLAAIGGETMPGSPSDFGKLIAEETGLPPKQIKAIILGEHGDVPREQHQVADPGERQRLAVRGQGGVVDRVEVIEEREPGRVCESAHRPRVGQCQ